MKRLLIASLLTGLASCGTPALAKEKRAETISGPAIIIDGDTLIVALRKVRLVDMDAFEPEQICERGGNPWPCGGIAKAALEALVEGHDVVCTLTGQHSYGRSLGRCTVKRGQRPVDVGGWMVEQGLAVIDDRFGQSYARQQKAAQGGKRGAWGGLFQMPCAFRGTC